MTESLAVFGFLFGVLPGTKDPISRALVRISLHWSALVCIGLHWSALVRISLH